MTESQLLGPKKSSSKIFQITVKGVLKKDWQEWFNGILIATEGLSEEETGTSFICKVRDQAELVGIVNWLHEMNMEIEKVTLIPE